MPLRAQNYLCLWDIAMSGGNARGVSTMNEHAPRLTLTQHNAAVKALASSKPASVIVAARVNMVGVGASVGASVGTRLGSHVGTRVGTKLGVIVGTATGVAPWHPAHWSLNWSWS